MSRLTRTLTAAAGAAGLTAALVAVPSPAIAAAGPDRIDLVIGSMPEGIAAGPGTTFFAGARSGGAIYVGDVRTGELDELVARDAPRAAVGMFYDVSSGLLWVAGGGPRIETGLGTVTAYDTSGRIVYERTIEGAGFLNDVVVTRDTVYVTDSFDTALVTIPLGAGGIPDGEPGSLPLSGDYVQPDGFGANGIRELPGGDLVLVSGGVLYAVDPATGIADAIEVVGDGLTGGDGLVLRGRTLYVVRGYDDRESIVVVRLSGGATSATVVEELVDEDFDVPTTAAFVAGDLFAVNGQFTSPADEPTEVVRVDGT